MTSRFPGEKTARASLALGAILAVSTSIHQSAAQSLDPLPRVVVQSIVVCIAFYTIVRFLLPTILPAHFAAEMLSLYWAGFLFFYGPNTIVLVIITALNITSPVVFGMVFCVLVAASFVFGVYMHYVWNKRATHSQPTRRTWN